MTKVVFGWVPQPIGGMAVVQQGFMSSFLAFCTRDSADRQVYGGYTFASMGYIPASRNALVEAFLKQPDADWLMMFDWDITFAPEDVYALLDAADPIERPIVSGVYVTYFGEDNSLRPCWMAQVDDQEYVPVSEFKVGEIIPLTVCGMGFTLMHRSVFERLEKRHEGDSWPWFGHDVINGSHTGEDLTFCARAREAGFSVWGHCGVLLGHTKAKTLTPLDMGTGGYANFNPTTRTVLNVGGASRGIPLPTQFAGWRQVVLDINPGPGVDLIMDAVNLVDQEGLAYDGALLSHVVEHFRPEEVGVVLEGVHHVLRPGSPVLVKTPDYGVISDHLDDLDAVAYESGAGPITWGDMLHGHQASIEAGNEAMRHHTMFTVPELHEALVEAGFENVSVVATQALELVATATA